jgi:hypothetical protein
VAQLSAEEAFRLLQQKHTHEHQTAWTRFEVELAQSKGAEPHASIRLEKGGEENDAACGMGFRRRHH